MSNSNSIKKNDEKNNKIISIKKNTMIGDIEISSSFNDSTINSNHDHEQQDNSIKLFVGQVPKNMKEDDLRPTMEKYGEIKNIVIIRDRTTSAHRGCAFVTYENVSDGEKAIESLHNKITLSPSTNPLQVRPAEGQGFSIQEFKLFVGMIPRLATKDEIMHVFIQFGDIEEIFILKNQSNGQSKGCAFLKFKNRESAVSAIENVNGKYTMEGGNAPLVVKFADSRKQRLQRARNQAVLASAAQGYWPIPPGATIPYQQMHQVQQQYIQQLQAFGVTQSPDGSNNVSPFMFYNPYSVNNYGYSGLSPYSFQQTDVAEDKTDDSNNSSIRLNSQSPSFIPQVGSPTGIMSPNHGFPLQDSPSSLSDVRSIQTPRPLGQLEGPKGANLFIYHLPHDLTDADLATAFAPFGTVISAKVYMDKRTGESKGFGFVSYDSVSAADAAIASMNGFQIGPKRLKVQHKRVHNDMDRVSLDGRESIVSKEIEDQDENDTYDIEDENENLDEISAA